MGLIDERRRIIYNEPHIATESGEIATFSTDMVGKPKECLIAITPYQSGTGTPTSTNVRPFTAWTGANIYNNFSLPSTYQELKYLECTGTQYIDTGITFDTDDFFIRCQFEQTQTTSQEQAIFSIWTSTYNYWSCLIKNAQLDCYTASHHYVTSGVSINNKYEISLRRHGNRWSLTQNGTTTSWNYTPSNPNNTTLKIFTRGDAPGTSNSNTHIKMYWLRVYKWGNLVGNFVPCKRISDSVLGMYDTVTNTFFVNQRGSGNAFVAGADTTGDESVAVTWQNDAGTIYGGTLDLIDGTLTKTWETITLNGTEIKYDASTYNRYIVTVFASDTIFYDRNSADHILCDSFPSIGQNSSGGSDRSCYCNGPKSIGFQNIDSSVTDAASFKTWITNNTPTVCYELMTPIVYHLTPSQIKTVIGSNKIWADTGNSVEVKYWTH